MHHREDNQINYDASSTMPYQRDNWVHLLAYCLRYTVLIWFELPGILLLRRRVDAFVGQVTGELAYIAAIFAGVQIAPIATTYVLILPLLIVSFALMRGNQLQHMFVSGDDPTCDFKHSYDLCNCPSNKTSFNDGFHIEHHLSPMTPWFDLPQKFLATLPKHRAKDSFIFSHITPDQVHAHVYSGRLDLLADHYVNIGQPSGVSRETLVAEMSRRLSPVRAMRRRTH